MKKILVAALILSAPAIALAQRPQKSREGRAPLTTEQRAEKQTARIDKIVQLTPEQRRKIQAENLRTAEAMQPHIEAIRTERQAMREIGKRRHEAYAAILTAEQKERLKAARKEGRQTGEMHRGGRAPQPGRTNMEAAPAPKE